MLYFSIDVETTGLSPQENQIIEFAAVLEDTEKKITVKNLPRFRALIMQPNDKYTLNPYCIGMHQKLFKEMEKRKGYLSKDRPWFVAQANTYLLPAEIHSMPKQLQVISYPDHFMKAFKRWLAGIAYEGKILPAGKNFYAFDWNFIKPYAREAGVGFHHRSLDPSVLFSRASDTTTPSLVECAERAGIGFSGGGHHTATADAEMVIKLLRYGWKKLWTK